MFSVASVVLSCDDEYQDTKDAGEAYMKSVSGKGIVTLNTGLKYRKYFKEDPSWPSVPEKPSLVYMNYTVLFINGDTLASDSTRLRTYKVVDKITEAGDTTYRDSSALVTPVFSYTNMLEGCRQAIRTMKYGSMSRIWIPFSLGYGSEGVDAGGIKVDPYTTLIYDIELVKTSAN